MNKKWSQLSNIDKKRKIENEQYIEVSIIGIDVYILSVCLNDMTNKLEVEWLPKNRQQYNNLSVNDKEELEGHIQDCCVSLLYD